MPMAKKAHQERINVTEAQPKNLAVRQGLVLGMIVLTYLLLAYFVPPGADTLWRLHVAEGILHGKPLYRDMIEVNPPLWFWGAIPAAKLGGYPALVGINLAASLVVLALFWALLRKTVDAAASKAGVLGLATGLFLINVGEIGQREQAFLAACALWGAIIAARIEGKTLPAWLVVVATGFAAYGFALKHYFVLVPVATEILLIWHKKLAWRPFRIETTVLLVLACAYAAAVMFITPDFLGRVLDLVQVSYYGFGPFNSVGPLERQLRLILQCAFVVVPLIGLWLTRDKRPIVAILVVMTLVSVVIVILQQKGWRYHLIAANGLCVLVMAVLWQGVPERKDHGIAQRFLPLGLAVLVWTSFAQPAISNIKTKGQPMDPALADIVAKEPRAHHVAILSTAPDNAFFPMARAKREHWSRHYSMWMMPGLLTPQADPRFDAKRLSELARVRNEFTADLMCRPPILIVGEVGYFRNPDQRLFDAMKFLSEDSEFSAWLNANYKQQANIGSYPIWRLSGQKPTPANCSKQF
jgi:hypothetical protein